MTRFAPSPTGFLHLGHIAHAVFVWGVARLRQGTIVLRIEDHDRGRSRAEYEEAIRHDLTWLGLEADREVPRQSERGERYQAAAASIETYWCGCSRRDIAAGSAGDRPGVEPVYPGTCRSRGLAPRADRGLRAVVPSEQIHFQDLMLGSQRQNPARQCGDLLVRDRHGNWTYQFAVTVDDLDQGITLVVRGRDLLSSTARQIQLARALGREVPAAFLHHPLLLDDAGRKLSKRDAATGVRDLRVAGAAPAEVLGRAAHLAGLQPAPNPLSARELATLFAGWG